MSDFQCPHTFQMGQLSSKVEGLEQRVDHLQQELSQIHKELRQISAILSEAKGGWRTLVMVGGLAAAVGAGAAKVAAYFSGMPK